MNKLLLSEKINYIKELKRIKKVADRIGNKKLSSVCDSFLVNENIEINSKLLLKISQKNPIEQKEEEKFKSILDGGQRIPTQDYFNSIETNINDDLSEYEDRLRNSVELKDKDLTIKDEEIIKRTFILLYAKYGKQLINYSMSRFIGNPETIKFWATHPNYVSTSIIAHYNKFSYKMLYSNIFSIRGGKKNYSPEKGVLDAPTEIEEHVTFGLIADKAEEHILSNEGLYIGKIKDLIMYSLKEREKTSEFETYENESFIDRMKQGLATLANIVVAQKIIEYLAPIKNENGKFYYIHHNKDIYREPLKVPFDPRTPFSSQRRSPERYRPQEGKRTDKGGSLQDQDEFHLRYNLGIEVNESGIHSFEELYDARFSKEAKNNFPPQILFDSKSLAKKIKENLQSIVRGDVLKDIRTLFLFITHFSNQILGFKKPYIFRIPVSYLEQSGISHDEMNKVVEENGKDYVTINLVKNAQHYLESVEKYFMPEEFHKLVFGTEERNLDNNQDYETTNLFGKEIKNYLTNEYEKAESPVEIYNDIIMSGYIRSDSEEKMCNRIILDEINSQVTLFMKELISKIKNFPTVSKKDSDSSISKRLETQKAMILYCINENYNNINSGRLGIDAINILSKKSRALSRKYKIIDNIKGPAKQKEEAPIG